MLHPQASPNPAVPGKDAGASCLLSGAHHHLPSPLLPSPLLSVVSPPRAYQQHYHDLNCRILLTWFILFEAGWRAPEYQRAALDSLACRECYFLVMTKESSEPEFKTLEFLMKRHISY